MQRRLVLALCVAVCLVLGITGFLVFQGDRVDPEAAGPGGVGESTSVVDDPREPGSAAGRGRAVGSVAAVETVEEGDSVDPDSEGAIAEADDRPVAIRGRVVDFAGAGVPDAEVVAIERISWDETIEREMHRMQRSPATGLRQFHTILSAVWNDSPATRTDAEGRFELRGVPAGDHRLVVRQPEFLPDGETRVVIADDRYVAPSSSPPDPLEVEIRLVAGARIAGRVVDEAGEPVADAVVSARSTEVAQARGIGKLIHAFVEQLDAQAFFARSETTTDASGAFVLSSLEPRAHDLVVRKEGFADEAARAVAPGREGLVVVIRPAPTVTGTVVSAEGEPVEGASLTLEAPASMFAGGNPLAMAQADLDPLGELTREATTGPTGAFGIDPARPGSWELEIRAEGIPVWREELEIGGEGLDLGEVRLAAGGTIEGSVVDAAGRPIASVTVEIPASAQRQGWLAAEPTAKARTDDRGGFVLAGVPPGSHTLRARAEGYAPASVDAVEVDTDGLRLVLVEGITAAGRVTDAEDGTPIEDATVRSLDELDGKEARTDAEGRFEIAGIPDPRGVDGEPGPPLRLLVTHPAYGQEYQHIREGDPTAIEVSMRRSSVITGVVVDEEGDPVPRVRVQAEVPGVPTILLRMGPAGSGSSGYTDEEGRFLIAAPANFQEPFDVVARSPGYAPARHGPIPPRSEAGSKDVEVRLQLTRGVTLSGAVRDPSGEPVVGAQVRAFPKPRLSLQTRMILALLPPVGGETAFTGPDGRYEIRGIERGEYAVETTARGFARHLASSLDVGADGAVHDVVLDAGGTLRGRVVDAEGREFQGAEVVALPVADAGSPEQPGIGDMAQRMEVASGLGVAATRSAEDGSFELVNLPEGSFRVAARAPGHEPAVAGPFLPDADVGELVLRAYGGIVGRVIDSETGEVVQGFSVVLEARRELEEGERWERDWSRGNGVVDAAAGTFRYVQLEPGDYRLLVSAEDYAQRVVRVTVRSAVDEELTVTLGPGARVSGIVVDVTTGRPVADVPVHVERYLGGTNTASGRPGNDRSREGGEFVVGGLPDGEIRLVARHPFWYSEPEDLPAPFVVPLRGEPGQLRIGVRPAGRVEGVIAGLPKIEGGREFLQIVFERLDEDGDARPSEGPLWRQNRWLPPDGNYSVGSLVPGRYRVSVEQHSNVPQTNATRREHLLGEVEVRAGDSTKFESEAPAGW